jgi:hypothetical protein
MKMGRFKELPARVIVNQCTACVECASFGFPAPGVFVFGSNEAGIHGAGAARHAVVAHEAQMGIGHGRTGTAYGIPTKDLDIETLPLSAIKVYVKEFLAHARTMPKTTFNVTRIGCGLAGYTDADIAPLFVNAPENCRFAPEWQKILRVGKLLGAK